MMVSWWNVGVYYLDQIGLKGFCAALVDESIGCIMACNRWRFPTPRQASANHFDVSCYFLLLAWRVCETGFCGIPIESPIAATHCSWGILEPWTLDEISLDGGVHLHFFGESKKIRGLIFQLKSDFTWDNQEAKHRTMTLWPLNDGKNSLI